MISYYRNLLDDQKRIEAFQKAINSMIDTRHAVAEIGSALGTYAYFAVRAGAHAVYAIETKDILYAGQEIARQNNLIERIQFYHGHSKEIKLPERVDFIIMEDYSAMFLCEGLSETMRDARRRFLKKSGKFIPNRIMIKLAMAQSDSLHTMLDRWKSKNDHLYGIDWGYITELSFNIPRFLSDRKVTLLSAENTIKEIDLSQDDHYTYNYAAKNTITRGGTIHGLVGWWDCWFTPDQYFSNSPRESNSSWGQLFFPLRYPVQVQVGETVDVALKCFESGIRKSIDYSWALHHRDSQQEYNTFAGSIFSSDQVKALHPQSTPALNTEGLITKEILNMIDGQISLQSIAQKLITKFPNRFDSVDEALFKITDVINRWSNL